MATFQIDNESNFASNMATSLHYIIDGIFEKYIQLPW